MTPRHPRSLWLLLLAVLALVAAGCGGDDGGGSSDSGDDGGEEAAEPLDEDEWRDAFNESCQATDEDLEDIEEPAEGDYEALAEAGQEALEIGQDGLDDLRELTPPDDLADDVEELLGLVEERVDLFGEISEAAEEEDDDALEDVVSEGNDLDGDIEELAGDLDVECFTDDEDSSDDFSDSSDDFSDDSSDDFSDDFSSDFSDDFSDSGGGDATAPSTVIIEYGTDPALDALAEACFAGDYQSCDDLFFQAAADSGYETYGDTCALRQPEGTGVLCTTAFG